MIQFKYSVTNFPGTSRKIQFSLETVIDPTWKIVAVLISLQFRLHIRDEFRD